MSDYHPRWLSRQLPSLFLVLTMQICPFLLAQEKLLPVFHFKRLVGQRQEGTTTHILRDSLGYVWRGTWYGLRRYDGYRSREYHHDPNDPYSLPTNSISSLLVDSKQRVWVGTADGGLNLFDRSRDRFVHLSPNAKDSVSSHLSTVNAIIEDHLGGLWLASEPPALVRVEIPDGEKSGDPVKLSRTIRFHIFPFGTGRGVWDICTRTDGRILVSSDSGLFIFDPRTSTFSRPRLAGSEASLVDSVPVGRILPGSDGRFWLGTPNDGLFQLDWGSGRVKNYRHHEGDSLSIRTDDILDIAEDRKGNLWLATTKGIDHFSTVSGKRMPYLTFEEFPPVNHPAGISLDSKGTLWVSSNFNIYLLSPRSQLFPHYSLWAGGEMEKAFQPWLRSFHSIERSADGRLWCLSEGRVLQIDAKNLRILKSIDLFGEKHIFGLDPEWSTTLLDRNLNFWYAAENKGLYSANLATGRVSNYHLEAGIFRPGYVCGIAKGSGDTLWIGGGTAGLMKFDPASRSFSRIPGIAYARRLMKDHEGKIWNITGDGLEIYDPISGKTDRHMYDPSDLHSLGSNNSRLAYEDPLHRIWVGSGNTVNLWDPQTRSFTRYVNPAQSQSATIRPIGSDNKGRLWLMADAGCLSILDPSSGGFKTFDIDEGVCGSVTDMETLDDGRILLTGWAGVNIISPDSIDTRRSPPPLVITKFTINDRLVVAPVLHNDFGSLWLSHDQDVIELEFAAIDIDAPQLVQYQYRLEGLEREWVKSEDRRYVRYPGLPPGDYVFRVRAASVWDEWPDQEVSLAITIAPPLWRTWWAYSLYGVLLLALLNAVRRYELNRQQLKHGYELKRIESDRLKELDSVKSRFFANISHEFRTPLTLILGPLETMRSELADQKWQHAVTMMQRSAQRLLRLINQLLDLSKIDAGGMKLQAAPGNIVPFVRGIAQSFQSSAGRRNVSLNVEVEMEEIELYFDREKMENILTNLLSNAFKFTPGGGVVNVFVRMASLGPPSSLEIDIEDTGIGIPEGEILHIFDRFYQVDASQTRAQEGTGIGLALVKELVDLHHGTIAVKSEMGKGTQFTLSFPPGKEHLRPEEIVDASSEREPVSREDRAAAPLEREDAEPQLSEEHSQAHPLVLVVEDNADVRTYIRGYLYPTYQVLEARDGQEGVEKARELIPDLVICDVMMPRMDGNELCKRLKGDERTSHVPIILLTAKAGQENKIEGLEIGADDYLVKPFDPKELLARIKNLIDLRRKLRERFRLTVPLKPGEVSVTSLDDVFLGKVMVTVEDHMGDEWFNTEELAAEVGMSRMQLHRKLSALTNQSAGEFIRSLRLHRAFELLQKDAGTVSEIAYMVGFSDPSYFSKSFHKQFGKVPSDVKKGSERSDPVK